MKHKCQHCPATFKTRAARSIHEATKCPNSPRK